MTTSEKISGWRTKVFVWIGIPIIAVAGLMFGAFDLVPAWQAKAGKGTPGTFTAVREDCGKRNCTWYGDFAPEGGSQRTDVILYDEPDGLAVGSAVPARHGRPQRRLLHGGWVDHRGEPARVAEVRQIDDVVLVRYALSDRFG